ncbi:hypothetical protein [Bosea sp. Root381]|uniref:hypothetical protein n=1 Tax=Bosea sp. Root381 TaxID=1736524 RepID=UPI0012E3D809|nr:hypothetical protein [Bosea sp. Root381]
MTRDPYELLASRAASHAASHVEFMRSTAKGDTPIEQLLFTALRAVIAYGGVSVKEAYFAHDEGHLGRLKSEADYKEDSIFLRTQVQLVGWRVDFLLDAPVLNSAGDIDHWRQLVIECDGHDFHERTKEQAAKDRSRDRAASLAKMTVFRFTGAELWRDPWSCAKQVCDWATKVRWGHI